MWAEVRRNRGGFRLASPRCIPIFVVLLDGLADRAHASLGGRTANEVADTPNLDRLAASGSCGVLYAVGPGRAPSSEVAHWSMLGYTPEEFPAVRCSRRWARAGGRPDDVLAFAALRPAERRDDGLWLTGRPALRRRRGRCRRARRRLRRARGRGSSFRSRPSPPRRGRAPRLPGADDRVTDTDAFFRDRHPVLRPHPMVPDAERTASAAESWTRRRSSCWPSTRSTSVEQPRACLSST